MYLVPMARGCATLARSFGRLFDEGVDRDSAPADGDGDGDA